MGDLTSKSFTFTQNEDIYVFLTLDVRWFERLRGKDSLKTGVFKGLADRKFRNLKVRKSFVRITEAKCQRYF